MKAGGFDDGQGDKNVSSQAETDGLVSYERRYSVNGDLVHFEQCYSGVY